MPEDNEKQPHWNNDLMVEEWMKNTDHKEWSEFSGSMLASGSCPPDYTDGYLRRQVGLLRYQFAKAGYDAPHAPPIPEKRSTKPKASSIAEKFGLTKNPDAIKPYEEAKKAREAKKS